MKPTLLLTLAAITVSPFAAVAEDSYNYSNSRKEIREDRRGMRQEIRNERQDTRQDARTERRGNVQDRVETRRGAVQERIDARRDMRNSVAKPPAPAVKP